MQLVRIKVGKHTIKCYKMSNAKTVESFEKLVGFYTGFGGSYKPVQQNLQVSFMATLLTQARQAISETHDAKTNFDNATNTREVKFKEMLDLCPRITNALKSSGASVLTVEDARAHVRKIQGKKLPKPPIPIDEKSEPVKARTRTARGLDYGSMADHFEKLVKTVSAEAGYQPNEPELSIAGLNSTLTSLRSLNNSVNEAVVRLNTARKNRNATFYTKANSVVAVARASKLYVRSAFGNRSPETLAVSKIRFGQPLK